MAYVFAHGLGQTAQGWDPVLASLSLPEPIYTPNLGNLLENQYVSYPRLYQGFTQYCHRQKEEKVHLCGLSLGAVLCLHYAIDYPHKMASLVVIAPQYKMPKVLLAFQNFLFRFLPEKTFLSMGFGKKEVISLTQSMATLDFTSSLKAITCPTLVLCGDRDTPNQKAAKKLSTLIKDASFHRVAHSKHQVNQDNPKALSSLLEAFYAISD